MIVSWITPDEPGSSLVLYWAKGSEQKNSAEGFVVTYRFFNYTSGFIHHCFIENLEVANFALGYPKIGFCVYCALRRKLVQLDRLIAVQ